MPPKFSELKVMTDSDRRKVQKQRSAEKKQQDEINAAKSRNLTMTVIITGLLFAIIVGIIIFFVSGERTAVIQQKEAQRVELKFHAGEVFKFDPKTRTWEKPSQTKIEEGEGIRTGKGGNITLTFSKGRTIKLYEHSEIIFNKLDTIPDNLDNLDVKGTMNKGNATFEVAPAPCTFEMDTNYLTVKMPKGFGAIFKVQYQKLKGKIEMIRVAVKTGRIQVMHKKTRNIYDVEGLNEIYIDKDFKVTGPQPFTVSSEVF